MHRPPETAPDFQICSRGRSLDQVHQRHPPHPQRAFHVRDPIQSSYRRGAALPGRDNRSWRLMIATFLLLSLLLALLPTLMMAGGTLALGLALAIVGTATVTMALTLHGDDLARFSRLLRPTAVVALFIPGAWMLLQVLPMPARWLANPIWASASAALDRPLAGTVSLDIGTTLLALARYCACLAAAFVAAAVTLNKARAESILSLLTAVATLIAAGLIGFDLGYLHLPGFERAGATDIAIIGFVLSCATLIRAYEQLETPTTRRRNSPVTAKLAASASVVGLVVCLSAILISGDAVLLFAALFGAGVLISAWAIRRWRLGLWGQIGIGALAALVVVGFFATVPARNADPTLALSTQSRLSSIERMLSDTKWSGSGAGSFEALSAIYGDTDEQDSPETPTAAAAIAIEMGQPFLWASVIVFLLAASTLFRRALLRGRDYVYPSAGGGCIAALVIVLFANDGILGLTASLTIGVLCGLAFAQSKSTSNRDINLPEELYGIPNQASDRASVEVVR
jgi:hypothetical protein